MIQIPDRNREEWQNLLTGKNNIKINSFVFKIKLIRFRERLADQTITVERAIDELIKLLKEYNDSDVLSKDIKNIFGEHKAVNNSAKQIDKNKDQKSADEVLKKMDREIISLRQQLENEKIEKQKVLEKAVLTKKEIEKKMQAEREMRQVLLKKAEKEKREVKIRLEKEKREKELVKKELEKTSLQQKKNFHSQNKTEKPKKVAPKKKQVKKKTKKPFMKSLLDFLNE
jgi:hypothetical protein